MEPQIHRNALKHLTRDQVIEAWFSVTKCIRRESDDEPPRWLLVGWLPSGVSVEMVAVELVTGWLVIHAMSPAQRKFLAEIDRTERGM